ncbi:MAG: hypothetical protein BWY44_01188 [Candidatus Omnitrophica bacterium ADurb.Bin292]|nr:MAG: hypothetical protein BWY44_01188 [Candidatus Omnitrophica bacterium ADurb.Bin292]
MKELLHLLKIVRNFGILGELMKVVCAKLAGNTPFENALKNPRLNNGVGRSSV